MKLPREESSPGREDGHQQIVQQVKHPDAGGRLKLEAILGTRLRALGKAGLWFGIALAEFLVLHWPTGLLLR